jgi:hypothetical protein
MSLLRRLPILCRGDATAIAPWLRETSPAWLLVCLGTIIGGCGLYGGVVGLWRAPEQALFTAVKLPLLVFLTCGANALLNGLFAILLGSGLGFRQTSLLILMSFTTMAVILAALAPVALFILLNTPALTSAARGTGHSITLLGEVIFIAYAGIVANARLLGVLRTVCATRSAAQRVFWSWLAGNLFLGAQLSWVLRPFIGSPNLPVQFLRGDPLHGNFYESVYRAFLHLF